MSVRPSFYPLENERVYCFRLRVERAGDPRQGTGWFVRPNLVVTAFHVVGDDTVKRWLNDPETFGPGVSYLLDVDKTGGPVGLRPVCFDTGSDIALLQCVRKPEGVQVLPLASEIEIGRASC